MAEDGDVDVVNVVGSVEVDEVVPVGVGRVVVETVAGGSLVEPAPVGAAGRVAIDGDTTFGWLIGVAFNGEPKGS